MKSRALWLLGVLLATSTWSQESATTAPALTPASFDRNSDSIKKIVRSIASSQSVPIQLSEEAPAKHEPDATFKYVPPVDAEPPAKSPTPRLPAATPQATGPISSLIETLLDIEPDDGTGRFYNDWLVCQHRDNLKAAPDRYKTCPGMNVFGAN